MVAHTPARSAKFRMLHCASLSRRSVAAIGKAREDLSIDRRKKT